MAFTSYADNKLIDHLLGSGTFTKPAGTYVALFIGDPASGGTEVSTSGSAYSRQAATFTITSNAATNAAQLNWSAATSAWGTITHIAIFDAITSGNRLVDAQLSNSKTIGIGDVLQILAGDLDVTLT